MKKYRIHKRRLLAVLVAFAAIIAAIYYIIAGLVSLISGFFADDNTQKPKEPVVLTPTAENIQLREKIDSFLHMPQRLDLAKIGIVVYDATTQRQVFACNQEKRWSPASCMKIPTAMAAIETLGLEHRYHESLQIRGTMKGDTLVGNLLVKCDDDPLLETFAPLTKALRSKGVAHIRGNIYYDLARVDTLRPHPTAKTWDIPYWRTPLLLKGKRFVERNFMATLRMSGVSYKHDSSVKPNGRYRYVAHSSHSLRDVLTPMLIHSSNIKAEAVMYHLDYKMGLVPGRMARWDIKHSVERYLRKNFTIGEGFVFNDGSGLSPNNRMTAASLVNILKYAYGKPEMPLLWRYSMYGRNCPNDDQYQ